MRTMVDLRSKIVHDVADYISSLTTELARMATSVHCTTLSYHLEKARIEAEHVCGREAGPPQPAAPGQPLTRNRN
jgi:hypothetical protein